jgi:hypothetical protein
MNCLNYKYSLEMSTCRKIQYGWNSRKVAKSPFRGNMRRARATLKNHRAGKSVGFTARSSLKSMGLLPRSSGCYELGNKYRGL